MKKFLLFGLSILCIFMILSISVIAAPAKDGSCGDSIEWSLDNGILTITGTGEMYDYNFNNRSPWMSFFTEINKIVISEGVTTIGDFAFNNCEMITEISIPTSVVSIGNSALDGCLKLKEIILPDNLTHIGESAFGSCFSLKELSIPSGVKEIKQSTFIACQNLEELYISNGTESIAANAFYDCFKLKITLPASISYIAPSAFDPAPKLVRCIYGSYAESYAKSKNWKIEYSADFTDSGMLGENIAWEYNNGVLTLSGEGDMSSDTPSYYDLKNLITKIVIGDEITSIPDGAFNMYGKVEEVKVGKSVYSIGDNAFNECIKLKTITFASDSLNRLGNLAFASCVNLTEIYLPYGLEYIGNNAFYFCTSLIALEIPDTVQYIGDKAFYVCTDLKQITLPQKVTYIGESALSDCVSLETVVLPDGIATITAADFDRCSALKYITIPDSVTYIDEYAFFDCTDLTVICSKGSVAEKYALENGLLLEGEYADVSRKAWYYESVKTVTLKGYMSGMGDKKFSPQTNLTRAQFVQLLFAMEKLDKEEYNGPTGFTDVAEGKWFSPAIKWANDTGITSGTGEGIFGVNGMVTREQLAQFMMKYAEYKDHDTTNRADISAYEDVSNVSDWAYPAIEWAVYEGIFTSMSDTSLVLAPRNFSTRAIAARVVSVFDTVINK